MTTCTLVAGIVSCLIDPGTRLPPADAARILAPNQYVAPADWTGPVAVLIASSATSGPFGDFPAPSPARRLDGSFLTDPPWQSVTYLPFPYYPLTGPGGPRHDARRQGPRNQQLPTRQFRR